MFITFEGADGSGKTTAINKLTEWLASQNVDYVLTREPGSNNLPVNKRIREILTDNSLEISGMTEAILFSADRRSHLETLIWPALKENKLVLCDRYFDSTFAYQGVGRDLGIEEMITMQEVTTEKTYPELTFYFDVSIEESMKRVNNRGEKNRLDEEGLSFVKKVHQGYKELSERFKDRYRVIDANKSPEEVFEQLKKYFIEEVL